MPENSKGKGIGINAEFALSRIRAARMGDKDVFSEKALDGRSVENVLLEHLCGGDEKKRDRAKRLISSIKKLLSCSTEEEARRMLEKRNTDFTFAHVLAYKGLLPEFLADRDVLFMMNDKGWSVAHAAAAGNSFPRSAMSKETLELEDRDGVMPADILAKSKSLPCEHWYPEILLKYRKGKQSVLFWLVRNGMLPKKALDAKRGDVIERITTIAKRIRVASEVFGEYKNNPRLASFFAISEEDKKTLEENNMMPMEFLGLATGEVSVLASPSTRFDENKRKRLLNFKSSDIFGRKEKIDAKTFLSLLSSGKLSWRHICRENLKSAIDGKRLSEHLVLSLDKLLTPDGSKKYLARRLNEDAIKSAVLNHVDMDETASDGRALKEVFGESDAFDKLFNMAPEMRVFLRMMICKDTLPCKNVHDALEKLYSEKFDESLEAEMYLMDVFGDGDEGDKIIRLLIQEKAKEMNDASRASPGTADIKEKKNVEENDAGKKGGSEQEGKKNGKSRLVAEYGDAWAR